MLGVENNHGQVIKETHHVAHHHHAPRVRGGMRATENGRHLR